MNKGMTGGRVREHVARLDVPPEPPAGSVVISSADGQVRQSVESQRGALVYPLRGDLFLMGTFTWAQLLTYGSVEVIWRPDADLADESTRGAARELLAALDDRPDLALPVEIERAARTLRQRLNGDLAADESGAPG